MMTTVLFLESVDPAALRLIPDGEFHVLLPGASVSDYTQVQAIVTRGKERVDRQLIDRCPGLRVIVRCGVGVNNIDVDYATTQRVQVLNVPGVNAATVAEHTIGLLLLLVRGMYRLVREVKAGNWNYRDTYAGHELRNLRLGIVGMGEIGHLVAGLAGALQMDVSYAGRTGAVKPEGALDLSDLLAQSDVVSLHLPLTPDTRGLIDAAALQRMKPGAFLINTARDEIVDASALLAALESGHLAGYASDLMPMAAADVCERIVQHPAVVITPHAASLTALTFREMSVLTVQHIKDYFGGMDIPGRYRVN